MSNNTTSVHDTRPTHKVYAAMCKHVYSKPECNTPLPEFPEWKVVRAENDTTGKVMTRSGYYGALYRKDNTNDYVLAHRGTADLKGWWEDFCGIFRSKSNSDQKKICFSFVEEVCKTLLPNNGSFNVSFTGHSLGGFLADLSVFICEKLRKSGDFPSLQHVNAVTFESPGSYESIMKWQSNNVAENIALTKLDIVNYVSHPNVVNTFDRHIGSVYYVSSTLEKDSIVNASKFNIVGKSKQMYRFTLSSHSMENMYSEMDKGRWMVTLDWPFFNNQSKFFDIFTAQEEEEGGMVYVQTDCDTFKTMIEAKLQPTKLVKDVTSSLRSFHFAPEVRKALKEWVKLDQATRTEKLKQFFDSENSVPPAIVENLKNSLSKINIVGHDDTEFFILENGKSMHEFRELVTRDGVFDVLRKCMDSKSNGKLKYMFTSDGKLVTREIDQGNLSVENVSEEVLDKLLKHDEQRDMSIVFGKNSDTIVDTIAQGCKTVKGVTSSRKSLFDIMSQKRKNTLVLRGDKEEAEEYLKEAANCYDIKYEIAVVDDAVECTITGDDFLALKEVLNSSKEFITDYGAIWKRKNSASIA